MKKQISGLALLVASGLAIGCGAKDSPLGDVGNPLAEFCPGLECKTIAETGGSVTGIAEFDAFFTAVANFNAQANILEADVRATLGELAAAAGATVAADATIDEMALAIEGEITGGFDGAIEGAITIDYAPPRCEVSAQATVQAAARCDATVDPGMATVQCQGTCEAEASAMAECTGGAMLECTGTAPSFACDGTCTGSCEASAGAACEGECKGTCELDGTAACDGTCTGTEAGGMCTGGCELRAGAKCEGTCKGSCELHVGATCMGECKGECTYQAPMGGCTGGAQASCSAMANASVECSGECNGEVTPPMVSAECEASVKAEADLKAECTPPSLDISYTLSADFQAMAAADASVQAAFEARIEAFGRAYGKLLAKGAKLELVANAGVGILAAADVAIRDGLTGVVEGEGGVVAVFKAGCALDALGPAVTMINGGAAKVEASVSAVGTITTAIAG